MATVYEDPITEEVAALAHRTHAMIVQVKGDMTARAFTLGRLFKDMRDQSLFRALGYDTFNAYIASEHLSMLRTTVYHMIGLYETYEEKMKIENIRVTLADIDPKKLEMIRPMLTETNWQDWVHCARSMGRKDLRRLIEEAKDKGGRRAGPQAASGIAPDDPLSDEAMQYDRETSMLAPILRSIVIDAIRRPEGLILKFDTGAVLRVWSPYGPDVRFELTQRRVDS